MLVGTLAVAPDSFALAQRCPPVVFEGLHLVEEVIRQSLRLGWRLWGTGLTIGPTPAAIRFVVEAAEYGEIVVDRARGKG